MRGHEHLIAMRKSGLVPAVVFLSTDPDRIGQARDWNDFTPEMAAVFIDPNDRPETLDLRFLIGLLVKVDGSDRQLVERVSRACITAKAARVIATTVSCADDLLRITGITDTEGVMTWQP